MHEAVHLHAWGRTRTLHEAVHEPSYFHHFFLFKQYFEPSVVCIWMHIVRKEFRSWIHYHKQLKLAFIALEWKCYKRTRAISRVRLYLVYIVPRRGLTNECYWYRFWCAIFHINPLVPNPIYTWRKIVIFTVWVGYLKVGTKPKTYFKNILFYIFYCHTCSLCRVELVVQFPARGSTQALLCLFMSPDRMIGAYCFCSVCLFVCLSVFLFVCPSVVNFNLRFYFWTVRDRDFIFGMHTPLMMSLQITPRSMTLWPWLWPWT